MEGLTTEETMKKKETRKVMVRLTQEQIDLALTAPISTARMPMCTEEQLASVKNKDLRDRIRESLANAAEFVYKSRESFKVVKEQLRAELNFVLNSKVV
jgi:hypothetical protein